jgi:integrase/recombinase XerD
MSTDLSPSVTPPAQPPATAASDSIPLPPPLRADSTLAAAVESFGEYMLRKGFSDNTIKAFRNDLKIMTGFLDGETQLHRISTRHLEEYLEWMQHSRGKSCSPKTLARRITTLKVFFGWLHGIGVLGTDPAEPVLQQPARTPLPIILRDEEVSRLLRAAQDYLFDTKEPDARPYLLISLLLQTGMKKAECANLLVSDIDTSDPQAPAVTIRYADERNAHKNRRLHLHSGILSALDNFLQQYKPATYLFECTPRNLEYVLDEVGKRAGIHSTQVGFETLRWTAAVRDFRNNVSEERLREKMGLSKISWRETREKIYRLTGRHELPARSAPSRGS